MKILSFIPFRGFTLLFLFGLAFGLPLGKIFMSISTIGISATWLLEGRFKEKKQRLKDLKYAPIWLSGLFFIPVIWLFNTSNYSYAFRQIELALPLLAFPIVIGTSPHIDNKTVRQIILAFLAGLFVSTTISFLIYLKIIPTDKDVSNVRNISIFMSHIRLSLMVCLGTLLSIYLAIKEKSLLKIGYIITAIWFVLFIIILKAGTAWVILLSQIIIVPVSIAFLKKKWIYSLLSISLLALFYIAIRRSYSDYHYIKPDELKPGKEYSENGEKYQNDPKTKITENGYLIYRNIAPFEVARAWNKRSNISIDERDHKGQPIQYTLYRYLTSKGLYKDSIGVYSLSQNEIQEIEDGVTSVVKYNSITSRLRSIFHDIDLIKSGKLEQGHTLAQRVAYLIVGWEIAKEHFWFGTGTGDVVESYKEKYNHIYTDYDKQHQLKALNQFLSLMVSFGIIGLILWLLFWIIPMFKLKANIVYLSFTLIIIISFLSDNTLHRQAGITFFAFFNSLLLFYPLEKNILFSQRK